MDRHRDTSFTRGLMEQTYPRMHDARQRAGVPRPIWQDMGPSAEAYRVLHKIQSADAPSKLDDIFKQGVLDARIHPARPRNRRRLQPVQREPPQHGRQNGTRRHPAGHDASLATANTPNKPANAAANTRPSTPTGEQGEMTTLAAWTWSRMASKYAPGLPSAQRAKPRNPRTPSTGSQQRTTNSTRKSKPSKNA